MFQPMSLLSQVLSTRSSSEPLWALNKGVSKCWCDITATIVTIIIVIIIISSDGDVWKRRRERDQL
jgi:hypothetical protein